MLTRLLGLQSEILHDLLFEETREEVFPKDRLFKE